MSDVTTIGGAQANRQGRKFEDMIAGQLDAARLEYERYPVIPSGSIYGGDKIADFRLAPVARFPDGLYIEAKWQDSAGSVDEKFPFVVACIREAFDLPAVLVVGGEGMKSGVMPWLRRQVDGLTLLEVLREHEFTRWLMRNGF